MADTNAVIRCGRAWVFACLLLLLLAGLATPARAALLHPRIFTVNSPADAIASGPLNNGICETEPGNGTCTLRAAIMKANHWPGGGAVIRFDPALNGAPLALSIAAFGIDDETTGDLNVSQSTHIIGNGAGSTIIDAANANDRAFSIAFGTVVEMSGLTIQHGDATWGDSTGAGIENLGQLTLDDVAILSDTAAQGGGGVSSYGVLTMTNGLVQNNQAGNGAGGGGLFLSTGTAAVFDSSIISNQALDVGDGGGILAYTGALMLARSTVLSNTATDSGGGLAVKGGHTNVVNSTLSGNSTSVCGGGAFVGYNSASLALYNVTVTLNRADSGLMGDCTGGGLYALSGYPLQLQNSLIAANQSSVLVVADHKPAPDDCSGALTSVGYNLIETKPSYCSLSGGPDALIGVVPDIGPLANNGGPTWTQALLPDSPAIDAGNPAGCTANGGVNLTTDQRGFPRPAFGGQAVRCDIGAFELQQLTYLPLVRQ